VGSLLAPCARSGGEGIRPSYVLTLALAGTRGRPGGFDPEVLTCCPRSTLNERTIVFFSPVAEGRSRRKSFQRVEKRALAPQWCRR
jgi:hypothetical protein